MVEKPQLGAFPTASPDAVGAAQPSVGVTRTCLVGGRRIVRMAVGQLLRSFDVLVSGMFAGEEELVRGVQANEGDGFDVVVLILCGVAPFATFRRIEEALTEASQPCRLVVLSEEASRGQVYAALRIGAKAYVNLDAEPQELVKAIELAACGRVYLAPDAAELLGNDVSTAIEPTRKARLPRVDLSRRETEIVQLMCEGLSSKEIGRHLHISSKTVENHRYNIYRKCEVDSIAALMRHAIQRGLVSI